MAQLTVDKPTLVNGALATTISAPQSGAAGGDQFLQDHKTGVLFDNRSATLITVTFNSLRPSDQGTDVNLSVAVAAGERHFVPAGILTRDRFGDTSGNVGMTYSVAPAAAGAAGFNIHVISG